MRLVYRDYPIFEDLGMRLAVAAECANDQQMFWEYQRILLDNQGDLSRDELVQFAADLNLDVSLFSACLDDPAYVDEVKADMYAAQNVGLTAVPTFFINGYVIIGAETYDVFARAIEEALKNADTAG